MKVGGHGTSFAKFLEFFLSICCYAIRGKWLKGYWLNIKIFEHRWTRAYDKKLAFSSIRKTRSMKGYRTTTVQQTRNVGTVRNACDPLFSFRGDFNCKNVHNSHKRTVEIVPFTGKADYGKGLKGIFFPFSLLLNFERVKRRFTVSRLLYLLVKTLDNPRDYVARCHFL